MSVGLTNEGPVTFTLDSRLNESGSGTSGTSTPTITSANTSKAARDTQRNAEKALRKAAWESAKKQTPKGQTVIPITPSDPAQDSEIPSSSLQDN